MIKLHCLYVLGEHSRHALIFPISLYRTNKYVYFAHYRINFNNMTFVFYEFEMLESELKNWLGLLIEI